MLKGGSYIKDPKTGELTQVKKPTAEAAKTAPALPAAEPAAPDPTPAKSGRAKPAAEE